MRVVLFREQIWNKLQVKLDLFLVERLGEWRLPYRRWLRTVCHKPHLGFSGNEYRWVRRQTIHCVLGILRDAGKINLWMIIYQKTSGAGKQLRTVNPGWGAILSSSSLVLATSNVNILSTRSALSSSSS